MTDPTLSNADRRAQLEAELAALDAADTAQTQQQTAVDPSTQLDPTVAPGPLAQVPDAQPVNDTATSPVAQPGTATQAQQPAPTSGYNGPAVGETVSHTFSDPYADDNEVTRYGVVIATHPADPNVAGSTDRAEIVWLGDGTAVLDVADLNSL